MNSPALRIRLRPVTPWLTGSPHGGRGSAEPVFHSDSLYGALCSALERLGGLEDWLSATAAAQDPAVRISSCFPFLDQLDFVPPPLSHWPPPHSTRVRWSAAKLAPTSLVAALLRGEMPNEERWIVDGHTGCVLPVDRRGSLLRGPFRHVTRAQAAVDRITGGSVAPHRVSALQFAPGAGLWCVAVFSDEETRERWDAPLRAAFRWLADSGFGGRRSLGFGRAAAPEFETGRWPEMLLQQNGEQASWWLLSLMTPSATEPVDWTAGAYQITHRGGRIESPAAWGVEKSEMPMVAEGSVLASTKAPLGAAQDVAPAGFPHPVWRVGFAVAVPIPAPAGGAAK